MGEIVSIKLRTSIQSIDDIKHEVYFSTSVNKDHYKHQFESQNTASNLMKVIWNSCVI